MDERAADDGPEDGARQGRFLVTAADGATAELSAVGDGQVLALSSNPGLDAGDVVEGTVAPDPPLGVTWSLVDVVERHRVAVEAVDEPPGDRARRLADAVGEGELGRVALDDGELHVVRVLPGETDAARDDVVGDPATRRRAARLGARRVEVRAADGLVAVRYLEVA